MMGTKKAARLIAVAGIAAMALTGCGSSNNSSDNTAGSTGGDCGNYNLAFMGALTGDAGALGVNMLNGVKLAVDEYNQKHADCKVNIKDFDSQGSPDKAPALATEIVQDSSIVGLIGPGFSGESLATGKTFFEAGLPSISPSATNVTITQQGWSTWHRVIGNDQAQGQAGAKYLTGTVGAKKVYVVDDAQDYSKGLATVVKTALQGTGNLAGYDEIQVGQTDMSAVVTKIKASGADAVYYGGYYTEAGLLVKQLRNSGFKGHFMSGDGSEDPAFVKAAGADAANGALLTAPAGPAPADFNDRVKAAVGADSGLYTSQAYDAANIFLAALDAGKTSHQDINTFIGSYTGTGVSGPIAFDQNGDIKQSTIWVYTVKNGKLDTTNPTAIK